MGAEGGWSGLERDPLPCEADHPDGQAEEVLQREGRSPGHQPQVPVRRSQDQRRRDPEGAGNGTGRCDRGVPGADWRAQQGAEWRIARLSRSGDLRAARKVMSVIPKNLEPFSMFEELL